MIRRTFGIIGCQHAHIGIFIREMQQLGHRFAGIYEPEPATLARRLAGEFGVPLLPDREALLGEDVSVIGCAAVNADKIGVIEWCELHGKHVMLDKPAVTDREGLDRLRAAIGRGRIEIGMLLTERFRSSLLAAKRLIEEGALGEIVHIGMRKPHLLNAPERPAWHFDKKRSGGIIVDLLIHDFDLLRWLTGREIASVEGFMARESRSPHPGFYDAAGVQAVMDGGTTAQLYADWHTPRSSWTWGDGRLFVTGTRGTLELRLEGDPLLGGGEALLLTTDREPLRRVADPVPASLITADFLSRLDGGPYELSHADLLAASEAAIAADERAVRIDRAVGIDGAASERQAECDRTNSVIEIERM
ncbi:Gfo/Idh/MocA family protein [Cohnella nanjingensis]|uniref:Gfo/Idh/MocA family oxidoreductase n=1 Tax=Cohnella nanjingensis TaxID=1387779 RepID=A0A7X0VEP0_9BACL|nr:Gfo/Idh/MocA family oxidoreductase [Cohnella nanjingensis]MBB6671215.1 Gfo/Idh/MocA family oxidoreductase [Cohnella nanjingensis]